MIKLRFDNQNIVKPTHIASSMFFDLLSVFDLGCTDGGSVCSRNEFNTTTVCPSGSTYQNSCQVLTILFNLTHNRKDTVKFDLLESIFFLSLNPSILV